MQWIPRVPKSEREAYENAARKDGYVNFRFTERSSQGDIVTAAQRAEYFPVFYVEPYQGNEAALGFDLASNPVRLAALERARDTGKMVSSGKIRLVQLKEDSTGVLLIAPIYRYGQPHETVQQRRQNLAGFSLGVVRVSKLFSLHKHGAPSFDIYVYSKRGKDDRPLYVFQSKKRNNKAPVLSLGEALSGPKVAKSFLVGEGAWTFVAKPINPGFRGPISNIGWLVLLFALLITGLLTAYMVSAERQQRILEAARDALLEREERLSGIMENAADGIITIDTLGRIESFNPAAEHMFGYPAEQVRGQNVSMLMPEADNSRHDGYIENYLQTGKGTIIGIGPREVFGHRKDGTTFPLSLAVSVARIGGQQKFIGIVRDITQLKENEQQLRQAHKMDAIGQLTGGVAHDFNNLLTAIIGNLELLEERMSGDAEAQKRLAGALHAALRGAELTKRLLAFSRKEALSPKLTNLNQLIPTTVKLLERTLGEDIEIETVLAGGLWQTMIDPGLLENALLNLAVNARDAMPDGGKLTIETANTRLDEAYAEANDEVTPGQFVLVARSDTGCGMSAETLEHVFEPFFTTKEVGKGTGLGLSMVFGFVKQSGGHIKIYSEEGHGTTVKLYFPRSSPSADAPGPCQGSQAPTPMGKETILVVEDDSDVRAFVVAALGGIGYTVLEAEDGPAALRLLDDRHHIDLLLTDVVMPSGMSGRDVANEVLKRDPRIKVLYTSGYTDNAVVHHGRLDEDVELLGKPYTRETLARTVRRILDS